MTLAHELSQSIVTHFGSLKDVASRFGYETLITVIKAMESLSKYPESPMHLIDHDECFEAMIKELPGKWKDIFGLTHFFGFWRKEGDTNPHPPTPTKWESAPKAIEDFRSEVGDDPDNGIYHLYLWEGSPDGDEETYGYPDGPDIRVTAP